MTDNLKPANKALVERVLGYGTARTYNRHEIDRIIDAARTGGSTEARASGEGLEALIAELKRDAEAMRIAGTNNEDRTSESEVFKAMATVYDICATRLSSLGEARQGEGDA